MFTSTSIIWWLVMMATGVQAEDSDVCVNSTKVATCFENGAICDNGNDYDNDVSNSLFDLHSPIVCNFSLLKSTETYNDDYPSCTTSTTEYREKLEDQKLHIPIEYFTGDAVQQHVIMNPLEMSARDVMDTQDVNISVSFGIGSTCDGQVILFFKSITPEEFAGETEVVAVEHLDVFLKKGGSIGGKGEVWGEGYEIHRRRLRERSLHIGCASGAFIHVYLETMCVLEINAEDKVDEEANLFESNSTTAFASASSSISHKNDIYFSRLGWLGMVMVGVAQFGVFPFS